MTLEGRIAESMSVRGITLEVLRRGVGPRVLLLHGFDTISPGAAFLDLLAARAEVIAPSHPGFGHSPRPDGFETIYDLVRLYLDVLDALGPDPMTLVGFSFGGWLAAELAVTCHHRLGKLVLVDAFGIKVSDRETPDILDIFNTSPSRVEEHRWHDAKTWTPDYNAMSDDELICHARNRDALCLYGWRPYMYNPQLRRWLRRIDVPTLVLWGESDRVVTPAYGRAYADAIPNARFELIERAGHHPDIEQPHAFAATLANFVLS